MHRFERILGAPDVERESVAFGCGRGRALMLETDQQLGKSALDRFEMIEATIGLVELLDQSDDAILQMRDRGLVAARELKSFQLVGQPLDHGIEGVRVLAVAVAGLQRVRDRGDPLLDDREYVGAGDLVDLGGECPYFFSERRQRMIRRDARNHAAQRDDRTFQLFQRGGIVAAAYTVDLLRQMIDRILEADQVFGRRQSA